MIKGALLTIVIALGWIAFIWMAVFIVDWLAVRLETIGEML